MKISQIRDIIDRAAWTRNDLAGHTRAEFIRRNVVELLRPQIEEMRALNIPPRFTRDIERRDNEIRYCEDAIFQWQSLQPVTDSALIQ
jgi:hypothetical protein